jgi:hypothetical protein
MVKRRPRHAPRPLFFGNVMCRGDIERDGWVAGRRPRKPRKLLPGNRLWPTGPVLLPHPFIAAGHWAQEVRPEDFGPAGTVYRLRFQAVHPEFSRVAPRGAVHACLTVPGQGTFQSTAGTAPIRPFSPVRNQLQQITGQRFFPNERTDDGRH